MSMRPQLFRDGLERAGVDAATLPVADGGDAPLSRRSYRGRTRCSISLRSTRRRTTS
jgi:hypothetical protein